MKAFVKPSAILVLGSRPGRTLSDRILRAKSAIQKFPNAKVVLTGNESQWGEISAMKEGLHKLGITGPFLEDPEARNTFENLMNSKSLVDGPYLIVTSDFHFRRAVVLGFKLKMPMVVMVFDADSGPTTSVWIRERLADIKACWQILTLQ
jgi:uncharacterized SAM-binding protein YcdF (DUF218 family)